jgi:hypothetical protein
MTSRRSGRAETASLGCAELISALLLKCFVPVIYSLGGRLRLAISSKAKSRDMHAD